MISQTSKLGIFALLVICTRKKHFIKRLAKNNSLPKSIKHFRPISGEKKKNQNSQQQKIVKLPQAVGFFFF